MARALWLLRLLLLFVLGAASQSLAGPACPTLADFLASNPGYSLVAEAIPGLNDTDLAATLLLPQPSSSLPASAANSTGAAASVLPSLVTDRLRTILSELLLQDVFEKPADLAAAGEVLTASGSSVSIIMGDTGDILVTFSSGLNATVIPVAFPLGKSVVYMMSELHGLESIYGTGDEEILEGLNLAQAGKCKCSVGCGFSTVLYFICWPICCASCYTKGTYGYQLCFGFDPDY